jgi:hypothetical protein
MMMNKDTTLSVSTTLFLLISCLFYERKLTMTYEPHYNPRLKHYNLDCDVSYYLYTNESDEDRQQDDRIYICVDIDTVIEKVLHNNPALYIEVDDSFYSDAHFLEAEVREEICATHSCDDNDICIEDISCNPVQLKAITEIAQAHHALKFLTSFALKYDYPFHSLSSIIAKEPHLAFDAESLSNENA